MCVDGCAVCVDSKVKVLVLDLGQLQVTSQKHDATVQGKVGCCCFYLPPHPPDIVPGMMAVHRHEPKCYGKKEKKTGKKGLLSSRSASL